MKCMVVGDQEDFWKSPTKVMDEYVDVMVHGPSQKNISRSGLVAVPEKYVHMVQRVENQKGTNSLEIESFAMIVKCWLL